MNYIPLCRAAIRRLREVFGALDFDRIYDAWGVLESDARPIVSGSLERYLEVEQRALGA